MMKLFKQRCLNGKVGILHSFLSVSKHITKTLSMTFLLRKALHRPHEQNIAELLGEHVNALNQSRKYILKPPVCKVTTPNVSHCTCLAVYAVHLLH